MAAKSKKRKWLLIISINILIIGLIIGASYIYSVNSKVGKWDNLIYPGITINNKEVSGLKREEALDLIEGEVAKEDGSKSIAISINDKAYVLELKNLELKYNIEAVVDEALAYGKGLKLFDKYTIINNPEIRKLYTKYDYNEEKVLEFVEGIYKDIYREPVAASLRFTGGKFVVTPDVKGYEINKEAVAKQIHDIISEGLEGSREVAVEVKTLEANVTAELLNKINSKISSYSTNYSSSGEGRAHNVELAARLINGTVIMPGESFSYNKAVGPISASNGYKKASVYVAGAISEGIGGGVCQPSSTLYVAAMQANLRSVTRRNHSMTVRYVPKGLDATVVDDVIDYQFKNDYDFPIYIQAVTSNRTLTFNIYGNKEAMGGKSYKMTSEIISVTEPTVTVKEDPNLEKGKTRWEKEPMTGYVSKTYLETYQNNKMLSRELVSTDKYLAVNGVKIQGTKVVAQPPSEETAPPAAGNETTDAPLAPEGNEP